jgi:hypothetical protein
VDLDFVRIECEISADYPVQLTAALNNALRNFEEQFKASCCLSGQEPCFSCDLQDGCPYRIIFNQKLSSDPEVVRLHQKPSLPFSLYIRGMDGNTSSCTIGLVVIGTAVNHLANFHTALLRMAEVAVCTVLPLAKYTLRSYCLDYHGRRHEITPSARLPESVILLSGQYILQNTVNSDFIRLSLISPLRLLSNGSILRRFDFGSFFRSQMRRCSSICSYYGAGELDLDFVLLSEAAQKVAVFDDKTRYSQPPWSKRQNRSGLTGTVECSGLAESMFALLLLGSYFNAGKGAAFGFGFHQLEVID